jgi:hypothetical protein
MSYSVENLRIIANAMATDPAYKPDDAGIEVSYIREAADEIERLREEVKYLDRLNRGTASTEEVALRLLKKFDERDAARAALEGK